MDCLHILAFCCEMCAVNDSKFAIFAALPRVLYPTGASYQPRARITVALDILGHEPHDQRCGPTTGGGRNRKRPLPANLDSFIEDSLMEDADAVRSQGGGRMSEPELPLPGAGGRSPPPQRRRSSGAPQAQLSQIKNQFTHMS